MPHCAHLTMTSATSSAAAFEVGRVDSVDEADLEEDCLETLYQRQAR